MSKRESLRVLIEHSYILSDEVKSKLLQRLDKLSDEDVYNLGRFLAIEKKKSLEAGEKIIESLDKVLQELDKKTGVAS